jgi:L-fuconolactonase
MPRIGFEFQKLERPPGSATVAAAWGTYFEASIEAFGTRRCMFESNFPVDKGALSYVVLWNAMKRFCTGYSQSEKNDLFSDSANRFYKITGK